jgi:hypothetical protein
VKQAQHDPLDDGCSGFVMPAIGMSKTAALAAVFSCWGVAQINRTQTANHIFEQALFHDGEYLYFTDGVLTAIQQQRD